MPKTEYLQGALDLLILQIVALRPNHGWGIQQRIQQLGHPLAVLKFLRHPLHLAMNCHQQAVHRLRIQDAVLVNRQFLDNPDREAIIQRLKFAQHLTFHNGPALERGAVEINNPI